MIRTQVTLCVLLLGLAARADAITADELLAKNLVGKGGVSADAGQGSGGGAWQVRYADEGRRARSVPRETLLFR